MSDKRKETLSQQLANVELVDCVNFIPDQVMLCGKGTNALCSINFTFNYFFYI